MGRLGLRFALVGWVDLQSHRRQQCPSRAQRREMAANKSLGIVSAVDPYGHGNGWDPQGRLEKWKESEAEQA